MENIANRSFSLRDFYYILFRHKVFITILLFSTLLTVVAGVYVLPETYVAEAGLLVKVGRENVSIPTMLSSQQQVIASAGLRQQDINSEIEILKSRFIAKKIVDQLGIDNLFPKAPEPTTFVKRVKYQLARVVSKAKDFIYELLYRLDLRKRLSRYDQAVLGVQKGLSAEQIENSDVIGVRFAWFSPDIAEEVLENLIELYLERHLEAHKTSGEFDFLHKQVKVLEGRLSQTEDGLAALQGRKEITSFEEQKRLLLAQISNFRGLLKMAETELAEAKASISELKEKMSVLRAKITTGFNTVYREAEKNLMLEEVRAETLTTRREKLKRHLESYQEDMDKLIRSNREHLERLSVHDMDVKRLDRQIQVDEKSYMLYRQTLEEARISDVLDAEKIVNVRVIDPPVASPKPVRPKKLLIISLGIVLSLVVGLGFALVLEALDHSISMADDVKRYLNLPLLTSIQESGRWRRCPVLKSLKD